MCNNMLRYNTIISCRDMMFTNLQCILSIWFNILSTCRSQFIQNQGMWSVCNKGYFHTLNQIYIWHPFSEPLIEQVVYWYSSIYVTAMFQRRKTGGWRRKPQRVKLHNSFPPKTGKQGICITANASNWYWSKSLHTLQ